MGDDKSFSSKPCGLHPAYTVTNLHQKIRILDGVKLSYSTWVSLFQVQARAHRVMSHIDGTPPPAEGSQDYDAWLEIDALVLQWIYSTMSDELLVRVLVPESTAYEAWVRVRNIFLNSKDSRAAALEEEFTNLRLTACASLEAYCHKLKKLADQLNGVDHLVTDKCLVLTLVRGLPAEYDTVASYIIHSLPTWETACNMLRREHQRQSAQAPLAATIGRRPNRGQQTAPLTARSGSSAQHPSPWAPPPYWAPQMAYQPYWSPPWATHPPCPYPTQGGWALPPQPPNNRSNRSATPEIYVLNIHETFRSEVVNVIKISEADGQETQVKATTPMLEFSSQSKEKKISAAKRSLFPTTVTEDPTSKKHKINK